MIIYLLLSQPKVRFVNLTRKVANIQRKLDCISQAQLSTIP